MPDTVDDVAPTPSMCTAYDSSTVTYARLLEADTAGADWKDVARIVVRIDPDREPKRARRTWQTHRARAHWMTQLTQHGYRQIMRGGPPY
jgi:hypothetical protein